MSHFLNKLTAPHLTMCIAYMYVFVIIIVLYLNGFYSNSSFFSWGPPINFFGITISTVTDFYSLHLLIFGHQIVNNWVNSVVYPWIINSVQDPKNRKVEYSNLGCLLLINLFDIYSEIDVVFIIGGFMSQISFVLTIIIANLITSTIINWKYLQAKNGEEIPLLEQQRINLV